MHRLVLGGFLSLGAFYVIVTLGPVVRHRGWAALTRPHPLIAGILIVLPLFALLGIRVAFSVPADLGANWLFRVTEGSGPRRELAAVRKFMLLAVVAPAALAALAFYPAVWGLVPGLRVTALLVLLALLVVETMVSSFRKVPFTCSYLPGKANLKAMIGFYVLGCFGFVYAASMEVFWCAQRPARFAAIAAILVFAVAGLMLARRREREWGGFVYEETPAWQPIKMEL
jgi:hypothetical protein